MSDAAPLVTFALLCFNQERFVAEAIRSALAQDYSPLEILISDDASTDGTWTIVERLVADYRGPHRLRLNRNNRNLGVGAHCDLVMGMAQGEMVVLAAGDDIAAPDRATAIAQAWLADPEGLFCVASNALGIDESGEVEKLVLPCSSGPLVDALTLARSGEALLGGTLAVRRVLLDVFGPMGGHVRTCEDIVLPFRAALLGRVAIVEKPLVRYRRHANSLMGTVAPTAGGRRSFVAGISRMLHGMLAARQLQLADLARSRLASSDVELLRRALRPHMVKSEVAVALLLGNDGAFRGLLRLVRAGMMSTTDAMKILLMTRTPSLWFRYIAWRYAWLRRNEKV